MDKSSALVLAVFATLCFLSANDGYPVPKKQYLPYRPGYVPVYIRNGDTPLEEINLDLAEAFHAIPSGRSAGRLNDIKAARAQNNPEENGGYIVVKVETPTIAELAPLQRREKAKVVKEAVEAPVENKDIKPSKEPSSKVGLTQPDKKKATPAQIDKTSGKYIQKIPKE